MSVETERPLRVEECDELYDIYKEAIRTFGQPGGIQETYHEDRTERAQNRGVVWKGETEAALAEGHDPDKWRFVVVPGTKRWLERNSPDLDDRVIDLVTYLDDRIAQVHESIIRGVERSTPDGLDWFLEKTVDENGVMANGNLRLLKYAPPNSVSANDHLARPHFDTSVVTFHADSTRPGLVFFEEDRTHGPPIDFARDRAILFGGLMTRGSALEQKFPPKIHAGLEIEPESDNSRFVLVSQISEYRDLTVPSKAETHPF